LTARCGRYHEESGGANPRTAGHFLPGDLWSSDPRFLAEGGAPRVGACGRRLRRDGVSRRGRRARWWAGGRQAWDCA